MGPPSARNQPQDQTGSGCFFEYSWKYLYSSIQYYSTILPLVYIYTVLLSITASAAFPGPSPPSPPLHLISILLFLEFRLLLLLLLLLSLSLTHIPFSPIDTFQYQLACSLTIRDSLDSLLLSSPFLHLLSINSQISPVKCPIIPRIRAPRVIPRNNHTTLLPTMALHDHISESRSSFASGIPCLDLLPRCLG